MTNSQENLPSPVPDSPAALQSMIEEIARDVAAARWVQVRERLAGAIRLFPANASLYRALCDVCFQVQDYEAAETAASAAIELTPDEGDLWLRLGKARLRRGRPEEAEAAFRQSRVLGLGRGTSARAIPGWGPITKEAGVLVFSDEKTEWMLPWWHEHYARCNDLEVHFVDTGMTERAVQFCKARGTYLRFPPCALEGWFLKPFVLRTTPFRRTIYLDIDCEVRGAIRGLLAYEGFAIARDVLCNFSTVPEPVNSGVIVYDHGHELIDRWCRSTLTNWRKFRGDQDVLDHEEKVYAEIPPSTHWLRLRGENPDALIFHHTGPTGKEHIAKAIRGERSAPNSP